MTQQYEFTPPCELPRDERSHAYCLGSLRCQPIRSKVRELLPNFVDTQFQEYPGLHGVIELSLRRAHLVKRLAEIGVHFTRSPARCPQLPHLMLVGMMSDDLEQLAPEEGSGVRHALAILPSRGGPVRIAVSEPGSRFSGFGDMSALKHRGVGVLWGGESMRVLPTLLSEDGKTIHTPELYASGTTIPLEEFHERHPTMPVAG